MVILLRNQERANLANMGRPPRDAVGLGERLREARVRAGLTQAQLAKASGESQSLISGIETGEKTNPTRNTMLALERALGLWPGDLMALAAAQQMEEWFAEFMQTPLGKSLHITPDDEHEIKSRRWFGPKDKPDDADWYDYVRTMRRILERRKKP